uniref:Uncharacterized protein n=1 Tax=Glossina pallidipes TaxID=7398 RepID=A0A1A9Z337_GLOPL
MQSIATSGTEYDNRKSNVTISTTSFIISPYTTAVTIAVAHKPDVNDNDDKNDNDDVDNFDNNYVERTSTTSILFQSPIYCCRMLFYTVCATKQAEWNIKGNMERKE